MRTKMKKRGTVRAHQEALKSGRPQRAAIETLDRSPIVTPNPDSKAIQPSVSSEAKLSEAVKVAVADLMKQTFGTKDEELQDRMLKQAADVVPDFAGRELKTFDQIAAALRGIAPRDSLEGMLGVQLIAVHTFAMELMRRAALGGQTDLGVEVNVNRATKLLRAFTSLTEALSRYRGKVEQKKRAAKLRPCQMAVAGCMEAPAQVRALRRA
jgi:hypothetical protein